MALRMLLSVVPIHSAAPSGDGVGDAIAHLMRTPRSSLLSLAARPRATENVDGAFYKSDSTARWRQSNENSSTAKQSSTQ